MSAPKPILTARQAECLRLVPVTSGSKEIAAILGIEPGTVDQHIKAATKALGEGSRHAAARKFAVLEGGPAIQKLDSQPPAIAPEPLSPPSDPTGTEGQPFGADWTMRERQAPFLVTPAPASGIAWPFATKGRPRNALTWKETLVTSWLLSAMLGIGTGAIIAGVVLLMDFLIDVSRHGG